MTTTKDNTQPLIQAHILNSLDTESRAALSLACRWREYTAGAVILSLGDDDDDVRFIQSGRVRVTVFAESGRQIAFREIGPGGVVGEFAAIDGRPRSADVTALGDVLVASLSASRFRALLSDYPAVALAEMQRLTAGIRELTDRVLELSSKVVADRLCAYLLRVAEHQSHSTCPPWVIEPAPTHQEIASHICTQRESVTRELRRLEEIGAIGRSGRQLTLHPDKFGQEMVGGVQNLSH